MVLQPFPNIFRLFSLGYGTYSDRIFPPPREGTDGSQDHAAQQRCQQSWPGPVPRHGSDGNTRYIQTTQGRPAISAVLSDLSPCRPCAAGAHASHLSLDELTRALTYLMRSTQNRRFLPSRSPSVLACICPGLSVRVTVRLPRPANAHA